MFTTEHFIWIGICVAVIAVLTVLSKKLHFSLRTASLVMAGVSLASELSKILSHMEFVNGTDAAEGMVLEATALPFHLCSLLIFAFFYLPFSKEGKLRSAILSLTVPVGLIGALLAILMATSGTDFAEPYAYQCFLYHAVMLWFAIYLVMTKQVDLGKRAWGRNLLLLFSLAVGMLWLNSALQCYDTNFWYVVRPPVDGLPLLNLDNGWYAYAATLLILGFAGVTLVHLPFLLRERKKEKTPLLPKVEAVALLFFVVSVKVE